jgi:hypothetical protein
MNIHRRDTEYAELLFLEVSPPRPQRLRGELSETYSIGAPKICPRRKTLRIPYEEHPHLPPPHAGEEEVGAP